MIVLTVCDACSYEMCALALFTQAVFWQRRGTNGLWDECAAAVYLRMGRMQDDEAIVIRCKCAAAADIFTDPMPTLEVPRIW